VSSIVAELLAEGVIELCGALEPQDKGRGRPADRLRLASVAALAIAVDLGRWHVRVAVGDMRVSEESACADFAGVLLVSGSSVDVGAQQPPASFRDLRPVHSYNYRAGGAESVPVFALLIGDIALVGVQAELSSKTGIDIKARSQFGQTVVLTMVNGGAKYMAEAASYDKITYAAMNSRFAQGAAEAVSAKIVEILADWTLPEHHADSEATAISGVLPAKRAAAPARQTVRRGGLDGPRTCALARGQADCPRWLCHQDRPFLAGAGRGSRNALPGPA
jgi:hypothetical protein